MPVKFRRFTKIAFMALNIGLLSPQLAQASEADAFTPPIRRHPNGPQNQGLFSRKLNPDGSGPGGPEKPGGGGSNNDSESISIPELPATKSIKETERYIYDIDKLINQKLSDSDSETEELECQIKPEGKFDVDFDYILDENGNPNLIIPMKDGTIRRIEFNQTRNKWYHADIFPNISAPEGFDKKDLKDLKYRDKLKYLKKNIPDEAVIKLQNEIAKTLSHPEVISAPGFLGKSKIEGTIDINLTENIVSFTDGRTNKHRTIVRMSNKKIANLTENDFHLFPNA